MLWWFFGIWLASGAAIPVLLLLRAGYRLAVRRDGEAGHSRPTGAYPGEEPAASAATPARGVRWLAALLAEWASSLPGHAPGNALTAPAAAQIGRYALAGLLSIGALSLLYASSFSESMPLMRERPASPAVAGPPALQAAFDGSPAAAAVAPPGLPSEPPPDAADQVAAIPTGTGDAAAGVSDEPVDQAAAQALLTAPSRPKAAGSDRSASRRRPATSLIGPYVTRSSRGTWLFPAATNSGSNS
jgi:hypothetical protein